MTKLTVIFLSFCLCISLAQTGYGTNSPVDTGGTIDLAICLDASGSMKPLIETVRMKLWEIVNDLALVEPRPRLRVALLTFGSRKNGSKNGYIGVETVLTEDLDLVYERLFSIECGGGLEYVTRVLRTALENLEWSPSPSAVKLIFVAGNEPADQDDQVSLLSMGMEARRRGVILHAIYCGNANEPDAATWNELAELSEGLFAAIDHRSGGVLLETPFDQELADLGDSLNGTYIPFGEAGQKAWKNQKTQDWNARSLGIAAAASRAQAKASPLYFRDWDLVEAVHAGRKDMFEIDESELPEAMREMTAGERQAHMEDLLLRRHEMRRSIIELGEKRNRYIAQQVKAKSLDDSRTFDGVVRRALREQLESRGYRYSHP